jgi:hypothetical protein
VAAAGGLIRPSLSLFFPSLRPLYAGHGRGSQSRQHKVIGQQKETARRLRLCPSLTRMFASGRGVLVSLLAMFMSRFGVIFRVFVLAKVMMMRGLMMMMRGGVVISGGLMMMLTGWMPRGLCHGATSSQPILENGCRLDSLAIDSIVSTKV